MKYLIFKTLKENKKLLFAMVFLVFILGYLIYNNLNTKLYKNVERYDFILLKESGKISYSLDSNFKDLNKSIKIKNKVYFKSDNGVLKVKINNGFYFVFDGNFAGKLEKNQKKYLLDLNFAKLWYRQFEFAGKKETIITLPNLKIMAKVAAFKLDSFNSTIKVIDGNLVVFYNDKNYILEKGKELLFADDVEILDLNKDSFISRHLFEDNEIIESRKSYFKDKYSSKIKVAKMMYSGITDDKIDYYLDIAAKSGLSAAKKQIENDYKIKIPDKYLK